jgi:hypothetical protein
MELLTNPGFERGLDLEHTHDVLVIHPDGSLEYRQVNNIDNPKGWTVWFRHEPDKWDQPEGHLTPEVLRIKEGGWGYHLFSFFRKMDAGLFQRIHLDQPAKLTFNAWAHAWSNAEGHEHSDDACWSEGPGYGPGFLPVGHYEGLEHPTDWMNFTFTLGLDVTGGIDPTAETVKWCVGSHIYNEYRQISGLVVLLVSASRVVILAT